MEFLFVVVLVSLAVKEWYPFSHFAMYSRPARSTWYVYVTDGDDRPINLRWQFGTSVIRLRKHYSDLRKLDPSASHGERGLRILRHIVLRRRPLAAEFEDFPVLRLWRVKVQVDDQGRLVRKPACVAELTTR